MIFYFSGTGNSKWVAETVAHEFDDRLVFIPDALKNNQYTYTLDPGEKLGFIFPCYAWGVPTFIADFICKLNITVRLVQHTHRPVQEPPQNLKIPYLYYIATCGDDTGSMCEEFCNIVQKKGWECHLGYDIIMPESYICLPGFNTDTNEKERKKITQAKQKLNAAIDDVLDQRKGIFNVVPGGFKNVKSIILRGAFNKWLMTPQYFHVNEQCIGCGECENQCPFRNIHLVDGAPQWGSDCVMCLRCYHSCVTHAIEWGRYTKNKGQYLFRSL